MDLQQTQHFFPHRFLLVPGVLSPLTCRHRGPCACHAAIAPDSAASTTPPQPEPEHDEFQAQFPAFVRAIYTAVTPFSEARQAVLRIINDFAGLTQPNPYPEPGFP